MIRPKTTFSSRARMAAMAAVASLALAACNQTDSEVARKANKPLTPQMLSLISQKDMSPASPILVRIFKQEAELEVWKQTNEGAYALLKTYPICRWSGELGPKVRIGDRQAPEGFYNITPGQMNPNSNYYLSFNLGFPNAYDKAYGRTGEFLMVHGDCSSAGCYAMTDEQISEIFSLARESFAGGQRSFQVQAYPFRMTPKNLAKHRNNPNMAFWRNLKQGSDHFEVSRQEPKVAVCGRTYVFDAQPAPGARFDADGACPPYQVPAEVANAVAAKQRSDDAQVAALAPSAPAAPARTGSDGGMHPVFLAEFKRKQGGSEFAFAPQAPGTVPETTRPPVETAESRAAAAADAAMSAQPAAAPAVERAPAPAPEGGNAIARMLGFGDGDTPDAVPEGEVPTAAAPLPPAKPGAIDLAAGRPLPAPETRPRAQATPAPAPAPQAQLPLPTQTATNLSGAAPIMTTDTFSR